jgi:ADP-ribosylglycohydrolase
MASLKDKFAGCIAGSWAGSAMGAAVEGWDRRDVEKKYGLVDRLLPYKHYVHETNWKRLPGTTEDGIERQKLIATAIIEKRDRILASDLVGVWLRDLKPEKMKYKQEAFDRSLLEMARTGVPASELGKLWPYPNVVSMSRASHPLGLINAGDPQGAADDSFEVGKVYCRETHFALRWAALYNAGIAEACSPGATVESVLGTVRKYAGYRAEGAKLYAFYDTVAGDVEKALEMAAASRDWREMRERFDRVYFGGGYFNYGMSQANEIVAKGLAVFAISRGDPKKAIIAAVNFGRDTDCLAAVAGGLSGALSGARAIPREWIRQVDRATKRDPYTNNRRTIAETAAGLYAAFQARRRRLAEYARRMQG